MNTSNLKRLGLHYAKTGLVPASRSHKRLYDAMKVAEGGDMATTEAWQALAEEIEDVEHDVIVSSELIAGFADQDIIDGLAEFFRARGRDPIFICFFRDVPAYFNSRYGQDCKNLRCAYKFRGYVKRKLTNRAFNYQEVLSPFEAAGTVRVVPFRLDGEPIEISLLAAMDRVGDAVDQIVWRPIDPVNLSFSAEALNLARVIAADLPSDLSTKDLKWRIKKFKALTQGHLVGTTKFVGCDAEFASHLREAFAEKTAYVAARYFKKPWEEMVPPDPIFERFDAEQQAREAPQAQQDSIRNAVLGKRPLFDLERLSAGAKRRLRKARKRQMTNR